jgi:HPt (histidine-containing phosphotransfer) domain-containing protein
MNPNMTQHQINLDTLDQIQKQMGDVFLQLISAYIEQTDKLIADMPAKLEQGLYADLQRHAHSVKSSSLNIGAEALSNMSQQLETLSEQASNAAHTSPELLLELIRQIQQEYASVKPQLEEYR